jgi:circadian clock protein KaiC
MRKARRKVSAPPRELPKCPSGIHGFDQITQGGFPRGRPTLICGGAGTGKTLFGIEFLVRGAVDHGETGVLVSFEERSIDLAKNVASLGLDLKGLVARKKICIEQVMIDRSEANETGPYNLEGLFIRLGAAIDSIGAKRVVLDTMEVLFASFDNLAILRSELRRLFQWLKDKGVTTVVTGERGVGMMTRNGLEEYVSDCVILLDQRVTDQIATRHLRIVKYRGSMHGTNEYPFLIGEQGILVLPITTIKLAYSAPSELVSTGIRPLDDMMGGKGCFRGGITMVSGGAGTGKTSVVAHFIDAACRRGERAIFFAFEESPAQIARNMRSIGIDLEKWVKRGLLQFFATRPSSLGLEGHISMTLRMLNEFRPRVVAVDPVSSLESAGSLFDARAMLLRTIDLLKSRQITSMFTSLMPGTESNEQTAIGGSSLIDTWVIVRNLEQDGERTRRLDIIKSRGRKHSNQTRELVLTDDGIKLEEIYVGPNGILVGAERLAQQMHDRSALTASRQDAEHNKTLLARKRLTLNARIAELESEFAVEANDIETAIAQEEERQKGKTSSRAAQAKQRAE